MPAESKIFELTEVRQMIQCDVCGKRMRDNDFESHQLKACFQQICRAGIKIFDDDQSTDSNSSGDTDSQ